MAIRLLLIRTCLGGPSRCRRNGANLVLVPLLLETRRSRDCKMT